MGFLFLISLNDSLFSSDLISFKQLTELASNDLGKNIYLDKNLPKYSVEFNIVDYQKKGQIYEFYKIVLFENNLELQYNKRGDFYFIKQVLGQQIVRDLPRTPKPAPEDKLHYYTYRIKNITNEDVVKSLSVFPNVKFEYLEQSDIIAYSSTLADHRQVQRILEHSDNKVQNKTIKITMFSVNRKNILNYGSKISDFNFNYSSSVGNILTSLQNGTSNSYTLSTSANFAFTLSALQEYSLINILQKPTILLTNGMESTVNSVLNVPYLKTTSTVDSQTNSITEQFDYKDVGLQIKIKPKIKDDWVYLDLNLISDELISLEDDKPITQKVSYRNSVMVSAGKPILLTGIKKTSYHFEKSGVPFLSDLPYFGNLFKFNSKNNENQNINILIEIVDSSSVKRETKEAYKTAMELF